MSIEIGGRAETLVTAPVSSVRFSPATADGTEIWYLGPMNGPKSPRFWTEDSRD
ncbi:MAG: hypothetical protein ACREYF_24645 [Gammaproteobacteria bacterium]